MNRTKLWLATIGTFLVFVLLAVVAGLLLHPHGREWLLLAGVIVLGLLAAFLVYYYLAARLPQAAQASPDDAVDAAAAAARVRLAAAGSPGRLPTVLLLGPSGGSKSTIVAESGLEPELLAGEVRRGEVHPSTVNVWYAQGTVFVEAGGALLDQPARWLRMLRHFRPRRLGAALAGKPQAPRLALVCFPCDEFLRAGAAQAVPAAAQTLRTRLLEVAREFGVRLPVYVLFTRTDRIPHFTEYVRSLSREEAQEVLGATLPAQPPVAAALHAEREAQRVAEAFRALLRSLALRRPDLLGREVEEAVRDSAYEFPREVRKISDLAVQFLAELTRPSHLGISPFLRGFYFTGVRPIVVDDVAAAPAPAPQAGRTLAATGVFDARSMQAAVAAAAASSRGRRVPEWVFLRRLFPDVILADRSAAGATARGSRVHALRRAALAASAVVCLVAAVGFTTSYLGNRRLEGAALAAARTVPTADAAAAGAISTDGLRRLDALRAAVSRLRRYDVDGAPLHLRWGLYAGGAMLPELRRVYFGAFGRLMWSGTRDSLLASLRALPAAPTGASAYGPTFDALKAHLVTTSYADSSTGSFLAPVLMRYWADPEPGPARTELAQRQFEFFGNELPFGNPFSEAPDAALIAQTQHFLAQFGDEQRLYSALVSDANAHVQPLQFSRIDPTAAPAVRDEVVVPGAFTRAGWTYVQDRLRDVRKLFNAEPWVVGPAAVEPKDQARIAASLSTQYATDYVAHWQAYLAGASIGGFGSAEEASSTLGRLSDPGSPLLRLLALASANTNVDTMVIGKAFRPVHAVVPPTVTDKLVVDANMPYVKGLAGVKGALDPVLAAPAGQRAAMMGQVAPAVEQARAAVMQIAQAFPIDGPAQPVGAQVTRLLTEPLTDVGGLLQGLPSADANGKGRSFCRQLAGVLAKYPFNPRSAADASIDELSQLFQPGNNAFTALAAGLPDLVVQQGPGFAAKIGASPQPSPAFIAFLNRAAGISRTLWDGAAGPQVAFTLRPATSADIPEVTVTVDGQFHTFTRTSAASYPFVWDGARSPHDARITGRIKGAETTLVQAPPGTWALFRLLQQADWERSGAGWTLHWRLQQGGDLTADISFAKGAPVFARDYLGGFYCVPEVVR